MVKSTCVCCEKDYNVEESTATNCEAIDKRVLFCSQECEAIDEDWLTEGNKVIESAKQNNPSAFARTTMSKETETALNSLSKLGVKFSTSTSTD